MLNLRCFSLSSVALSIVLAGAAYAPLSFAANIPESPDKHDSQKGGKHHSDKGDKHESKEHAEEEHSHHGQALEEHHHEDHGHEKHDHDEPEMENIVVQASRSGRIADELPVRVELINREEIMEKATMRPGNISMLVAETGGVRVQTTSPALGSANIRLQGLYGRYTQLLADGLPLYGNQAAAIGLLQIPPTDLGRVEIIKGSASSLYGGSALGGVINLVSRRPGDEFLAEALVNVTSRDGQDVTSYIEAPLSENLQGSITTGLHHQGGKDLDSDGWLDLAGYERFTVRPRLFWQGEDGDDLYVTLGVMEENRHGGTAPGASVADGNPFRQVQDSRRIDTGLTYNRPLSDSLTLNSRFSAMVQQHEHSFGGVLQDDQHESYLLETSVAGFTGDTDWLLGAAFQSDVYSSDQYRQFDYSYQVPGLFVQLDHEISEQLSSSISARLDDHSDFGTQLSPRVSLLYRPGEVTIRGSWGQGYFAPTPFVEEIEAAGLDRLENITGLREEQAQTTSVDMTWRGGNVETSLTLFASNVDNVTDLEEVSSVVDGIADRVRLVNAQGESQIRGSELLLRYYWRDIKLTASYLYLDASEQADNGIERTTIPLTPKHSAGFVAMWEQHGNFRVGFEAYYTGTQRVNDNPYIERTSPYWHMGLMGEITTGQTSWFVNLENLLDVRQTDEHPLLLPTRAANGQWTTDIWSRNDGFIVNAGVRIRFSD